MRFVLSCLVLVLEGGYAVVLEASQKGTSSRFMWNPTASYVSILLSHCYHPPLYQFILCSSNFGMHRECSDLRSNFIQFHHIVYINLPMSHFTMCLHMLAPFAKPSTTVLAASANSRINFWPSSLALGSTLGSQVSWKCCCRHSQQSSLTMCS